MHTSVYQSYAKINLGLSVLRKREDGYHDIATIFQQVDLHDTLTFESIHSSEIVIVSDNPELPKDRTNLVVKAINKLFSHTNQHLGVRIRIEKRIPMGGGLGGGSSNAAVALIAVNSLLRNPLSQDELVRIGAEIGSDVPFFFSGGTALGEGRGEKLTPLSWNLPGWICLLCPGIHISTAWAYNQMKIALTNEEKFTKFKALFQEVSPYALDKLENDFEGMVFQRHPILLTFKELLRERGAFYASMSGSGSSLYGLFSSYEEADAVRSFFQKEKGVSAFVCKPMASSRTVE